MCLDGRPAGRPTSWLIGRLASRWLSDPCPPAGRPARRPTSRSAHRQSGSWPYSPPTSLSPNWPARLSPPPSRQPASQSSVARPSLKRWLASHSLADRYKAPPPNSDGRVNSNGCSPLCSDTRPCDAVARVLRCKLASRSRFGKVNTSEVCNCCTAQMAKSCIA